MANTRQDIVQALITVASLACLILVGSYVGGGWEFFRFMAGFLAILIGGILLVACGVVLFSKAGE